MFGSVFLFLSWVLSPGGVVMMCVVFCVRAWVRVTSSQVGRGSQVGKVIQADDIDDGADHSCVILGEETNVKLLQE